MGIYAIVVGGKSTRTYINQHDHAGVVKLKDGAFRIFMKLSKEQLLVPKSK